VLPHLPVVYSERAAGYIANAIAVWFLTRFREIGIEGASSHSGRSTFITAATKKITEAGGSLRDIQELVGHSSLATTYSGRYRRKAERHHVNRKSSVHAAAVDLPQSSRAGF